MIYKYFDKTSSGSGVNTGANYEIVNEIQRQIIREFKR